MASTMPRNTSTTPPSNSLGPPRRPDGVAAENDGGKKRREAQGADSKRSNRRRSTATSSAPLTLRFPLQPKAHRQESRHRTSASTAQPLARQRNAGSLEAHGSVEDLRQTRSRPPKAMLANEARIEDETEDRQDDAVQKVDAGPLQGAVLRSNMNDCGQLPWRSIARARRRCRS